MSLYNQPSHGAGMMPGMAAGGNMLNGGGAAYMGMGGMGGGIQGQVMQVWTFFFCLRGAE